MVVLGTKLHVPTSRRPLVARPRLTARLHDGEARPRLVLVSAPAGFGKTTVLAQWLAGNEGRAGSVAWLSLDEADNDVGRFLLHLVASLQRAGLTGGGDVAAMAEASPQVPVETVLTRLVNELDELASTVVVALDDYHVVDGAAVHDAVAFLLDHLPPHVTIALATRSDPPLPLARLRARAELVEVRASDLRFTPDEAAIFLNDVMGLDLAAAQVAALDERTEGWAAGLQLAALSLRGHGDVAAFVDEFTGSHRFVLDYLVEEVLRRQPERVARFLLDTAVLRQLTGPLCDAVTGGEDGQAILEELERGNLFVVPLDEQRSWYRYHHLFADTLRARLAALHPERPAVLHGAASRWYADHGHTEDAISHALAAGTPDRAADLVELALPEARRRRRDRILRGWLTAIPDDLLRARPTLGVGAAWTRLVAGDLDGVESWLADAERSLATLEPSGRDDPEVRSLPAWIAIYRASVAQARHDAPETSRQARRALDLAGPDDPLARGGAAGFLGLAAWASGDLPTAVTTFSAVAGAMRQAGNASDALGSTVVLADMWLARGSPREARRLHEQALLAAREDPVAALPIAADLHVGLAEVLREQGDLDEAEQRLRLARELGEASSLTENHHRWFVVSAGLRRARGDHRAALDLLDEAEARYVPGFFPDVRPIPAQRARAWIAQGDLDAAAGWAAAQSWDDADCSYLHEFQELTWVRLAVARCRSGGDPAPVRDALARLSRLREAASAGGRGGTEVEIDALEALARHALGDNDQALSSLARALAAGVPAGYARVFLDEGGPMLELLRAAVRRPDAADEARLLLRLAGAERSRPPTSDAAPEALSDRELEVVRLLATTLTGPEIARQLFVSLNTLRTHTRHIFTKLDVNTRQAAVRRAGELGLL